MTSASADLSVGVIPKVPMPVGDIAGWTQIFADDFDYTVALGDFPAQAPHWYAYPDGWKDTSKNGTYEPSLVCSVGGSVLDMYLHTDPATGLICVSAPVPLLPGTPFSSWGVVGQLYGRYSACFRSDPVPGFKTAWLLWPDSNLWPTDGEIDFPEGNLNSNINAYMHWQGGTSGSSQTGFSTKATYNDWHVMVLEWTASACTFILDGTVVGSATDAALIPSTPMHWVLQTETQLSGGAPLPAAAGHVQVDWVTVYSPA